MLPCLAQIHKYIHIYIYLIFFTSVHVCMYKAQREQCIAEAVVRDSCELSSPDCI